MDREEAKEVFLMRGYVEVDGGTIYDADKWRESCTVISEWLIEQQPCGDAISRQAALRQAINAHKMAQENGFDFKDICEEYLNVLPPVNPQQKAGHWIAQDIHNCHTDFKCSECGYIHNFMHLFGKPTADYTYCPNCGCRMVEPQEG